MSSAGKTEDMRVLFDFDDASAAEAWFSINDTVMGGVSDGGLSWAAGRAIFSGTVSLANNGGFASVRSQSGDHDLAGFDGIALRLRGDGKRYKLGLRSDCAFDGVVYQAAFDTTAGTWEEVRLLFAAFVPTHRGRVLRDVPALDPGAVQTFGLSISDKQAGPFSLEIDWIAAYRAATKE